jgi:hypothetical protein
VLPVDPNAPVLDDVALYRRINPTVHLVWDDNLNCRRISTGLFRDPDLSVGLGDVLEAHQRAPETLLDSYPDQYLVAFPVSAVTEVHLTVVRDPVPDEPAHARVPGKKTQRITRALSRACKWIVKPDDGCGEPYPTPAN